MTIEIVRERFGIGFGKNVDDKTETAKQTLARRHNNITPDESIIFSLGRDGFPAIDLKDPLHTSSCQDIQKSYSMNTHWHLHSFFAIEPDEIMEKHEIVYFSPGMFTLKILTRRIKGEEINVVRPGGQTKQGKIYFRYKPSEPEDIYPIF